MPFAIPMIFYERLGGFDESLTRLVDYDLIMRFAEVAKIYSIPVLLSYYYYDNADNTITSNPGYIEHLMIVRDKQKERRKLRYSTMSHDKLDHGLSIVIPNYESLDDVTECINSILNLDIEHCSEIVVVDNASSELVRNYLTDLESNGKINLILNDTNYGFTYAVNQGIGSSNPDNDILIMNNDAILTPGAVQALQNNAYKLQDCGITVPQQLLPVN